MDVKNFTYLKDPIGGKGRRKGEREEERGSKRKERDLPDLPSIGSLLQKVTLAGIMSG